MNKLISYFGTFTPGADGAVGAFQFEYLTSLGFAALVIFAGRAIVRRSHVLRKFAIPAPVISGLLFSVLIAIFKGTGILAISFDTNVSQRSASFVIKDSERARLDNAYLSALKRLGLTPAAACGIQSLLTPKTLPGQTAPEENAPAASPQPKQGNSQPAPASALQIADQPATRSDSQQTQPVQQSRAAASRTVPFGLPQSAARQRTDCYVVQSTKVQGGMSGSSTLVTLRAPDGKQIPAFARGARPELSTGTVLSNVKLTMRQQDTVAFYVLESYEIVPQEDRAA